MTHFLRLSSYKLEIRHKICFFEMKTNWKSIFLDCFLPSPVSVLEAGLNVRKPLDVNSADRFPNLWD